MSLGLLATPTVTICKAAKMVFNVAPGNFYLSQYLEYQEANGTSATVEALAGLAGGTDAAFITTVLTNLGLADDAGAQSFLETTIAASGRGAALEAAITALDNVAADDATYGSAKTAFDSAIVTSVSYSTNTANNSTEVSVLASAISADSVSSASGSTFSLTAGLDFGAEFVGGSGDDVFNAAPANNGSGVFNVETLTIVDTIDGGDGQDVLNYTTIGGDALPAANISNIETINLVSDGAGTIATNVASVSGVTTVSVRATTDVDIDTDGDVTSVTVTGTPEEVDITDNATTDVITTVSITGSGNSAGNNTKAVTSTALTSLTLSDINGSENDDDADDITSDADGAITINLEKVSIGAADLLVSDATSAVINTTGGTATAFDNEVHTLDIDAATSVTFNTGADLTVGALDVASATTITATGAADLTITAATLTALTSIDASEATGGVDVGQALGVAVDFTGGSGADSVSLGATTRAITTGAGDDEVTISASPGTGGSIDAGDGSGDTIQMTEALAANDSLSANATFEGKISNFEKLSLTTVTGSKTVNLANLDDISYVKTAAATALVLDNLGTGGTVEMTAATNDITANVKDASVGGNNDDVLNLKVTAATSGGNVDFGAVTAANVETINVESTRTGTIVAADTNQITLTVANAKDIVVTGDVDLNIDTAFTMVSLESINGAANTNGLTVSTASATQGIAITGSATAANTLTGGDGGDVFVGGSKVDIIVGNAGNDVVTAGAGDDVIEVGAGTNTVTLGTDNDTVQFDTAANGVTTITNFTLASGATSEADTIEILDASGDNGETAITAQQAAAEDITTLTTGIVTINASTTSVLTAGTESIEDFTDTTDVAAYLEEAFTIATTEEFKFILNDGSSSYIYDVVEANDTTIDAGEVTLIATVDAVLLAADVSQT